MKKACFLFGLLILATIRMATPEDCKLLKRRQNRSLRRYQPKLGFCPRCRPRHGNLILLGFQPKIQNLKKCFSVTQTKDLKTVPPLLHRLSAEDLIIIIPKEGFVVEPEIVSLVVETFGNVSLLLPMNHSLESLSSHCRSLSESCFELNDFLPILVQMKTTKEVLKSENEVLKDIYEEFKWNREAEMDFKKDYKPSLEQQWDVVVKEFCKRNKSLNTLVEILQEPFEPLSINKNKVSDDLKLGLSLRDLLPIDSKSYDKNLPPKLEGRPTSVHFHVTVLSLDSINEESMTYVADIFLAQSWRDSRLRLPESMSEEYRILDVDWLHYIWRPDSFFKNAKHVTFHEISIPNHYVWLYHDKTILYMSKLSLVLSCAMKFESYPHDVQVCYMMIESLSHTVQDLIFLWNTSDPLVVNPAIELPQLDISNNYTTDCTVEYSTGNFTCLAVVFTLKRRLGYHLLHTYIPSALIVVMSWISFWIKPEAIPARVTLGVTSLLTLGEIFGATQNTQSQQSLPPVSYVKAIDIWMSSCSVFVFLSLMEFALVNNYMGPVSSKSTAGYSDEDLRSTGNNYGVRGTTLQPHCYGKEAALCIDMFSRYFFPFSFFILNAVYWSVFL